MSKKVLMQGNEACVEGAIAAGMRFFAGYPITPSTEIAEGCSIRLPQVGGHFIQMEDEIASMAAVIGASATGAKAMTATSGPGFSLKQENIGFACMAELPCVIVDVQRCGPSTGFPTDPSQGDYQQSRWGTQGDHPAIALSPSSVAETYSLIIRAFNLSEKYRTPVIFLTDEIIGHLREGIEIPDPDTIEIVNRPTGGPDGANPDAYRIPAGKLVPEMRPFGDGSRYNITGLVHDYSGVATNNKAMAKDSCGRILEKVWRNLDDIVQVEEYAMEDAEYALVCFGGTARAGMSAVLEARESGLRVGLWRPITVWPFPERELRERLPQLKGIIMAEHNNGQMFREVRRVAEGKVRLGFVGRIDGSVIPPRDILDKIREVSGDAE